MMRKTKRRAQTKRSQEWVFSVLVSLELYVPVDFSNWYYWILVCASDSNLRKFLVEISDTVCLDRLIVD